MTNHGYYGWQNDYFDPEPDWNDEDEEFFDEGAGGGGEQKKTAAKGGGGNTFVIKADGSYERR